MAVKHAVLSASSSERWLNCPPSARLCEAYEDRGSDYAAEGTDAHSLCEFRLKQVLGIPADDPIENLSWYNEEMEDCAAGYAAYVSELLETAKQACADPVVMIEQRVDFSRWVKEGFGTADCIIIADGVLNICDYKNGQGCLVLAERNPQMMLYALGALEIFDGIYDIDTVRMTIYQPRKSNISVYEMDKVKAVFAEERITQASAEFSDEDWQNGLELDKSGHVKNTLRNLTLILENDPNLKGVVFNQLLDGMEIKGEVPWNHPSKFWRDADDAQLISYVDAHYGTFSARNYDIAVTKVADDRA